MTKVVPSAKSPMTVEAVRIFSKFVVEKKCGERKVKRLTRPKKKSRHRI
jgi:hypothetical protein